MKMTANIYDLLFDLRDSLHCALEISPANPRTPTILRQNCLRQFIGFTDFEEGSKSEIFRRCDAGASNENLGESSNSDAYSSLRNCPTSCPAFFAFSGDAPASHLLKISDLLPSSKSVNPIIMVFLVLLVSSFFYYCTINVLHYV